MNILKFIFILGLMHLMARVISSFLLLSIMIFINIFIHFFCCTQFSVRCAILTFSAPLLPSREAISGCHFKITVLPSLWTQILGLWGLTFSSLCFIFSMAVNSHLINYILLIYFYCLQFAHWNVSSIRAEICVCFVNGCFPDM